jgi:predicted TIM-barrel fold metal-dependent hydrolase
MHGPTIFDTHQHVIPEVYRAELARLGVMGSGENPWPQWSLSRTLELMEMNGIAAVMTSIASPGAHFGDLDVTKRLVRACNEALADLVSQHPAKLGAMGFVPLPDVEAAAREVEFALDVLKLDGINLLSHTGDRYLGHPEEDALYAELDRRQAIVFIHPARPPMKGMPRFNYPMGYTELVFDTTRAVTNLLFNGVIARYPRIRFIVSHAGGVTPILLFRLGTLASERGASEFLAEGAAAQLKRLYYDIAQSAAPVPVHALLEIADPNHILFGTDYPFARNGESVLGETIDALRAIADIDSTLRRKIEHDNAKALFPRLASIVT